MLCAPSLQDAGMQVTIVPTALGLSLNSSSEQPGTEMGPAWPSLPAQGLSRGAAAGALFTASCTVLALWIKRSSAL